MTENNGIGIEVVLEWLHSADDRQISQVISAVIRRYNRIWANEEIIFLSLPRDDSKERRRLIERILPE